MITTKNNYAYDPPPPLSPEPKEKILFNNHKPELTDAGSTFVYHLTPGTEPGHGKYQDIESLQELEETLHPTDVEGVHTLVDWIQDSCSQILSEIKSHLYFTMGVRIRKREEWIRQYLVLEPREHENDRADLTAWLIPDNADKKQLNITNREQEVLELIAAGYSNKQVADILCISIHTAINHRKHLIEKFQVKNTAEMICEAGRRRLV